MSYFSVVIPTYNRAELLRFAVESVLQQTFDDFEIVISNGGSTDHTRDVVAEFSDDRIRYFESKERLPVGENYQNGLNNALGEYITFLSDDDAYTPNLLKTVKNIIDKEDVEIVGYQYCRYYHDDIYEFDTKISKNSLLISEHDGKLTHFSPTDALEQVRSMHALSSAPVDTRFICPYLSNATYKRGVFDSLRKKRKNLFDMVPADIYLAAAVFYESDSYVCVDEPLLVWSNWEGNSTATAQRSEQKVIEHYKRLLGGRELEHTPLKFPLALNCGANAVLEAMNDRGAKAAGIDLVAYFQKTYENFMFLKSAGVDIADQEKEFRAVLSQQSSEIITAVNSYIGRPIFRAKGFLNTRMPKVAATIRKFVGNRRQSFELIKGSSAGFSNVVEASRYVS
jgi:glycosyltransferase involved in cell wall biosynthesis